MKDNKYTELLTKLNLILNVGGDTPSVSPALNPSGVCKAAASDTLFITRDINVEQLSENQLQYVHVLLHKFFASGNKYLTKNEIKELHEKIRVKISHHDFDKLDEI